MSASLPFGAGARCTPWLAAQAPATACTPFVLPKRVAGPHCLAL